MKWIFLLALCGIAQGATTQPATQSAVTPEAQQVLAGVRDAYANLKTLTLVGTLSLDLDVGGQTQQRSANFTAAFSAPGSFRNEIQDDLLLGADGHTIYAWQASESRYFHKDQEAGRLRLSSVPGTVARALKTQDPSLALALASDAAHQLTAQATQVQRGTDVTLDGHTYQVLEMQTSDGGAVALIDARTHLLRRLSVDAAAGLARQRGTQDVKKDLVVFDYTSSIADAAVPTTQFTFVPPPTARETAPAGDDEEAAVAKALEGKPAPALSLSDLAGKTVNLAQLKGSVVVLDFWATWCGPCVESLPHLDALYQQKKDQGLLVYAVNAHEDAGKVRAFVQEHQLHLSVLLDTPQTNVAAAYQVNGLPQTVVIGRDGTVKKVLLGYDPEDGSDELRDAVEAALGE